jgi:hypothetical protein
VLHRHDAPSAIQKTHCWKLRRPDGFVHASGGDASGCQSAHRQNTGGQQKRWLEGCESDHQKLRFRTCPWPMKELIFVCGCVHRKAVTLIKLTINNYKMDN